VGDSKDSSVGRVGDESDGSAKGLYSGFGKQNTENPCPAELSWGKIDKNKPADPFESTDALIGAIRRQQMGRVRSMLCGPFDWFSAAG